MCIDLMDRMLDLDPNTRISVEDAFKHPYLESLYDEEDAEVFEGTVDFSFENNTDLSLEDVQKLILKEISSFNPAYYDLLN